jgi:cell division protein FtsN
MAPARKRKAASRGRQGTPAWMWLLTGVLIGLGLAWYLFSKGYIPQPKISQEVAQPPTVSGADTAEEVAPASSEPEKSRYDFFTVLPEMEVVVPEQELNRRTEPATSPAVPAAGVERYLLQVGSFREMSDAEQMKARLALLGVVARVQTVTVNETTWHRVRVGPVEGAARADEMRRRLADNGIESLVMKNP